VIRAGVARFLTILLVIAVASAAAAVLLGLGLGGSLERAVAIGWYLAGASALFIGFIASTRGPTRAADSGGWAPVSLRGRSLRWASRTEQDDSLNISAILVAIGFVLIVLGVAVDPIHALF
jgi:hypothetical protein